MFAFNKTFRAFRPPLMWSALGPIVVTAWVNETNEVWKDENNNEWSTT